MINELPKNEVEWFEMVRFWMHCKSVGLLNEKDNCGDSTFSVRDVIQNGNYVFDLDIEVLFAILFEYCSRECTV